MFKKYLYILLFGIVLLNTYKVNGQMTMPDNVCIGQTKRYNVEPNQGSTYTWWIDGIVQAGFTTSAFSHTWDAEGTYTLEVQELDAEGCLGPVRSGQVFVTSVIIPVFENPGPVCSGTTGQSLPLTSLNGITGTWSPATINTLAVGTSTYTFTPAEGQCASTATIEVVISNSITPVFSEIGPFCRNSAPPALPTASTNGITGTWSPASINTSAVGTSTYTFTPAEGQCASTATIEVAITNSITPAFSEMGPFCRNSAPPALPTASTNGISGTWNPAAINTSTVGTSTYTFTPAEGQCASPATIEVAITNSITPAFSEMGPFCRNSAPPALPTASTNGISGTWSPSAINTSAVGTSTYTFTPAEGQCASPATIEVAITNSITPVFSEIGPFCRNSAPPALPTASTNGISGTWSPAAINTSTVGTSTYTFTPAEGQCASTASVEIAITNSITPVFSEIGPFCRNSAPPALPTSSTNGISGTWSPAAINTSADGTSTYTFTPAEGQCASTATIEVAITNSITPVFSEIGPFCRNLAPPALPTTSTNGIAGTWNPSAINTSTVGTSTYIFTPAEGQCAIPTTIEISITNAITPVFQRIGPLTLNSEAPLLPLSSDNTPAITGTWNPSRITTNSPGTLTYQFTPSSGQCAITTTMEVSVLAAPSVNLVKNQVSGPNPVTAAGQVLTYQIILTNTGMINISGINATEIYPGAGAGTLVQPVESQSADRVLNPGETWRYSATYTVTQADIDGGRNLVNTISIVTNEIPGPLTASATTTVGATPSLSIIKNVAENGYSSVGNILHYSIVIRNTGSITLTNIYVSDPLTGLNQTIAMLAPGEARTFNTTHSVNQNDLNTGSVVNTAEASYSISGRSFRESASRTVRANQEPELELIKQAAPLTYSAVGEVIWYTITVRNNGNVTLSGIRVSDPLTGLNQVIATLQPGGSQSFSTSRTITQNDLNSGEVDNTAAAEYTFGGTLRRVTDEVTVNAMQNPGLSIGKSAAESSFTTAGDNIHYTITVTNTGNVTLSNILPVDANATLACTGSPFTLTPGSSRNCTATHIITAGDVAAGRFNNTATVSGVSPGGGRISATSNTVTLLLNNVAPEIDCPASLSLPTGMSTCDAVINSGLSATYSDVNNNIVSLTWVMTGATPGASPAAGMNNLSEHTFNRGVTTITYTVTDRPGLSSSCTFTVTVFDNVPPVASCLGQQNRNTDPDIAGYTAIGNEFDPVSVTDNCSVESVTNNINNSSSLSGVTFPVGVTNVVWTAIDASGNRASCNFTVTVTDNVPPVARCKDVTVYLNLNTGRVTLQPGDIDNGSFDNTGIESMSVSISEFDCSDIGPNNVTLSVTDSYGNTGTCTSVVTVLYARVPAPVVNTGNQVLCDGESTGITLTSNIPGTEWRWTVESHQYVTGAAGGTGESINQRLNNSDSVVHTVTYIITPGIYDQCDLPALSAGISVNPKPQVIVTPADTVICSGEDAVIAVRNPNTSVSGSWHYELIVEAEAGITGYSQGGSFTSAMNIEDKLVNSNTHAGKIVYRFIPYITSGEHTECAGAEREVTILVYPAIVYSWRVSDFNGFNISCSGKADGSIRIDASRDSYPLDFSWNGPGGVQSSQAYIREASAGKYFVTITDYNMCSVKDSVSMTEPGPLGMLIRPSLSSDGEYNINCAGDNTGSVLVTALNNVGPVRYIWNDGTQSNSRNSLGAGSYQVIISDANNCIADSSLTLTQPERLKSSFEIQLPYCPEKPDGKISLAVSGGVKGTDYNYEWSDRSTGSSLSDVRSGTYNVTIKDLNGCSLSEEVKVNAENDMCLIIPEAFSPNGDLKNDLWNIGNTELYPKMEVFIYNRWGQFLWKSEGGYAQPWDGRSGGRNVAIDAYHYIIDLHNGTKPIAGSVTIVR